MLRTLHRRGDYLRWCRSQTLTANCSASRNFEILTIATSHVDTFCLTAMRINKQRLCRTVFDSVKVQRSSCYSVKQLNISRATFANMLCCLHASPHFPVWPAAEMRHTGLGFDMFACPRTSCTPNRRLLRGWETVPERYRYMLRPCKLAVVKVLLRVFVTNLPLTCSLKSGQRTCRCPVFIARDAGA
jgi:hypothetical protein